MTTTVASQSQNISTVDALWVLIQSQTKTVRNTLTERLLTERYQTKTKAQQKMVEDSITRAFNELHAGKVNHNARNLFK